MDSIVSNPTTLTDVAGRDAQFALGEPDRSRQQRYRKINKINSLHRLNVDFPAVTVTTRSEAGSWRDTARAELHLGSGVAENSLS